MEVKTNILEKALLKLSRLMLNLSFNIDQFIYRKHDPEGVFNSWSRDNSDSMIIFSEDKGES